MKFSIFVYLREQFFGKENEKSTGIFRICFFKFLKINQLFSLRLLKLSMYHGIPLNLLEIEPNRVNGVFSNKN